MSLYSQNHPATLWKLLDLVAEPEAWEEAAAAAAVLLPSGAAALSVDLESTLEATLGEGQFGAARWRLGRATRLYYALKPFIGVETRRRLRRLQRMVQAGKDGLEWPVETRYAEFVRAVAALIIEGSGRGRASFIHFWPHGARFALMLTHDVEAQEGQRHVAAVADLEQDLGFRSAFNLVPERYPVDWGLVADLRARGFEVGVHDLRHDGGLFASERRFRAHAARINDHLRRFGARGFRSGFLHRNAEWMQELDIDYDTTFFDTDPFEPMPGGSMSIWPFQLGRFLEIPTTLVQDHTLTRIIRERTPRIWMAKIDYLASQCGVAAVNTHPDYLLDWQTGHIYRQFLEALADRADYWPALPAGVYDWWTRRAAAPSVEALEGAVTAHLEVVRKRAGDLPPDVEISVDAQAAAEHAPHLRSVSLP